MPQNRPYDFLALLAVGLSILGIAITLPLAIYTPKAQEEFIWRKSLIGSFLVLICIFGIFAAFFPEKFSKKTHFRKTWKLATSKAESPSFHGAPISIEGHHFNCGRFSTHVIRMDGHVFCASCMGLFLGALIVLSGTALYFFAGWNFLEFGLWAVLVGQMGVALGFFQFKFKGYARLTVNTFFVVASFLILAGIDTLAKNIFIDLYLIALILFWLFTRIIVSQRDHWRICNACRFRCGLK
jgi:hypothetical protein